MHVGLVCRNDVDSGIDLANAINDAGASVTLYLSHSHTAMAVDVSDRPLERFYEVGLLPPECKVRLRQIPRMRSPRSVAMIHRLSQTMRNDGIDVAHILMGPGEIWLAVLSCLLRNLPVVSTMVIPKPNVIEDLPDWVVIAAHRLLTFGSDVIIVNGTDQVSLVKELYHVPLNKIVYVPLCPRTTAYKWSLRRKTEEPGTVLLFGAARRHKGLEYLVRAQPLITRQIRNARILIASRGKELERCRQMIQDMSKFEIHDGFVSGDVMADFFQRASLVALPYLSASTSGILMTAYVFGKPVVATHVGSLPDFVENGVTGLLVEPANVEQLAEAIIKLLSDDTLRHSMGENAVRWVEESHKKVAMQTLRAYEKAISIHKGGLGHRSCGSNWLGFSNRRRG